MKKNSILGAISALFLLAFLVIWLIYLCGGNALGKETTDTLNKILLYMQAYSIFLLINWIYDLIVGEFFPLGVAITLWSIAAVFTLAYLTLCTFYILDQCNVVSLTIIPPIILSIMDVAIKIFYILSIFLYVFRVYVLFTESWIFRILFTLIALFLIFCVVIEWIPTLGKLFDFPLIGFNYH